MGWVAAAGGAACIIVGIALTPFGGAGIPLIIIGIPTMAIGTAALVQIKREEMSGRSGRGELPPYSSSGSERDTSDRSPAVQALFAKDHPTKPGVPDNGLTGVGKEAGSFQRPGGPSKEGRGGR
jgi:hypothetical protein